MTKYGFLSYHTDECKLDLRSEDGIKRTYWCETHGNYCYEYPLTTTNTYEDGTTYYINRRTSRKLTKVEDSSD